MSTTADGMQTIGHRPDTRLERSTRAKTRRHAQSSPRAPSAPPRAGHDTPSGATAARSTSVHHPGTHPSTSPSATLRRTPHAAHHRPRQRYNDTHQLKQPCVREDAPTPALLTHVRMIPRIVRLEIPRVCERCRPVWRVARRRERAEDRARGRAARGGRCGGPVGWRCRARARRLDRRRGGLGGGGRCVEGWR